LQGRPYEELSAEWVQSAMALFKPSLNSNIGLKDFLDKETLETFGN
jgi:hypothetical protein